MPKRNATTLVFTMGLAPYGKPRYAHAERGDGSHGGALTPATN